MSTSRRARSLAARLRPSAVRTPGVALGVVLEVGVVLGVMAGCGAAPAAPTPAAPGLRSPAASGAPTAFASPAGMASGSPEGPVPGSPLADAPSATGAAGLITVTSPAVTNGALLHAFRCEPRVNGAEASIPLAWAGVPADATSLAITMEHRPDPADPSRVSSYLLLWDIPAGTTSLAAGAADDGPWHLGANKDGVAISYTSPCSKGSGTHQYTITLWALGSRPGSLPQASSLGVTYQRLIAAIREVPVLATGTLVFTDTTP